MNASKDPPVLSPALGWILTGMGVTALILVRSVSSATLGENHDPGPRAFPTLISCGLLAMGVWEIARVAWRRRVRPAGEGAPAKPTLAEVLRAGMAPGLVALGVAAYAAGMHWAGFMPATLAFSLAMMRLLKTGWLAGIVASALFTTGAYLLFVVLFKVPLPSGAMGWPF